MQEAAALCAVPLLLGNVLGVLIGLGVMEMTNIIVGSDISGRHEAVGGYHPLVFVFTFAITILTVWISAWYPARKLSRLTPLEAIRNTGEIQLKKRKIPAFWLFLRAGRRTGRKFAEGAEKGLAYRYIIPDVFFSGVYLDAMFLYPFGHQYKNDIF